MGTLNWTLTWYRPEGDKSIEQIADEYSDFILKGMLK
jgi:TetR/AcrR family transcriptional regulator, cholesterol catabolism regulator